MPVGTAATVKTLSPKELSDAGVELVLGNTYHILHKPGDRVVKDRGGLGKFMGWGGPTLTDSGGFQVFSLSTTRKITEEGVVFQSIYDGETIKLNPESVCEIQWNIGADIIYALDECPPYPATREEIEGAADLTFRWAKRFMVKFAEKAGELGFTKRLPFLVVQGGVYRDLREKCSLEMASLEPPGFGIGGVSVGEPQESMLEAAGICCENLPDDKPRHLLGVGRPADILEAIALGVDLFDCVLPTRNGRNGQAFTSHGVVNVKLNRWKEQDKPLDDRCTCYACRQFGISYLNHLINSGEMLGMRLVSLHNITYYQDLLREANCAIKDGRYDGWKRKVEGDWE